MTTSDNEISQRIFDPSIPPEDAIEVLFTIDSPAPNTLVAGPDATIAIRGRANLRFRGRIDNRQITGVNVRLGADGPFEPAVLNVGAPVRWSLTRRTSAHGRLPITAQLLTNSQVLEETTTSLDVDSLPPQLTIDPPPPLTATAPPFVVTLRGSATDVPAGVAAVACDVGNTGTFRPATLSGTRWNLPIELPGPGAHPVTVLATDRVGHATTKTITIQVVDRAGPA
jgi:hypothetical protein